jgi:starch-binding outer membrane protein, SusD/RagB family
MLGLLIFTGCVKKLDLNPISEASLDNSYKNEKDINQAVAGAYSSLKSLGQYGMNFPYFAEIRSDNSELENLTKDAGVYAAFDLFRLTSNNKVLNETWTSMYRGIQSCNIILARIQEIQMNDNIKAVRIGEAKFIRALTYFNLVRIWGDVPLIVNEIKDPFEAFEHSRISIEVVYEQIIKDLKEASDLLLPNYNSSEVGRATKGAAQTLLAKVYLTRKQYSEAASILQNVISSNVYILLPNYADVFVVTNKNNKESIFEVQYKSGGLGQGSIFANEFIPENSNHLVGGIGPALGNNVPTSDLYNSYSSIDKRRDMIGILPNGKMYSKKFIEVLKVPNDGDRNSIVLRYADVLLMYAETLNEMQYKADNDAFKYLNEVRLRAGLIKYTSADLPDQLSFRLAVEKERRHELAFENHRWFDIVRIGRAIEIMNEHIFTTGRITIQNHQVLFPIPLIQIDASSGKLTQNAGYN